MPILMNMGRLNDMGILLWYPHDLPNYQLDDVTEDQSDPRRN